MKVLIVTYYWPPSGGSGVQRWLKFVKYLQEYGIEPVVYTVANPQYPIIDGSLEREIPADITVLKQPIWEPNSVLNLIKKNSTKESAGFLTPNPSVFGKILQYIRANYFIPDARKFWVGPSVKYLENYLSKNAIDAIITTGPPHSMHLIGLELKKKLHIKWISDFRDPWTEIDYFEQLPLTKKATKKHHLLEKEVLGESDAVVVIGKTMKEKFQQFTKSIYVVTNGFDTDGIPKETRLDSRFTITHIGLMNADRNPYSFWKAVKELADENKQFAEDYQIQLVGSVAPEVTDLIGELKLENVIDLGYLSHKEVNKYQCKSQILLLAVNNVKSAKGIITGKIFEYLQAKRPILAIGPIDGDLAEIIRDSNAGVIVGFNEIETMKVALLKMYASFKNGGLKIDSTDISQYHRKNLTKRLSEIIKETIS